MMNGTSNWYNVFGQFANVGIEQPQHAQRQRRTFGDLDVRGAYDTCDVVNGLAHGTRGIGRCVAGATPRSLVLGAGDQGVRDIFRVVPTVRCVDVAMTWQLLFAMMRGMNSPR